MRALTVRQPYASLLVLGLKEFETRSRRTTTRGRIAIHAGAHMPVKVGDCALFGAYPVWHKPHGLFMYTPLTGPIRLPLGAVIGTTVLDDVAPTDDPSKFTADEIALGDFAPGRWAWHMSDARPVQAVPAAGQLAWWDIDDELLQPVVSPVEPPRRPGPPGFYSPIPAELLGAVTSRHAEDHHGPAVTCTDPICDAAERWTR